MYKRRTQYHHTTNDNVYLTAKDKEFAVDALIIALSDREPIVREEVIGALGKLRAVKAVRPLIGIMQTDPKCWIRAAAAKSIGEIIENAQILPNGTIKTKPSLRDRVIQFRKQLVQLYYKFKASMNNILQSIRLKIKKGG